MPRRSIGFPLTIGIVLAILVMTLASGWYVLVVADARSVARGLSTFDWVLLVLGSVFFLLVMAGLFWLCAWLVREIRVNQAQRAFLDAVTHELKTPLASLHLYLDTLIRRDPEPERRLEFLHRMREDVARLDHTVGQVLSAARAEDPGRKARRQEVPLTPLLESCVERIRSQHGLAEDAVRCEPGPALQVLADPDELAVVFRNLLENAVKYSRDPVDVRVSARAVGGSRVAVEIADSGIGIPTTELRRIFQRFYRASRDVQRTAGLGLGLFIVRHLVRRQGGRVEARSEGRGTGSRFVVTLRTGAGAQAPDSPRGAPLGRAPAAGHGAS